MLGHRFATRINSFALRGDTYWPDSTGKLTFAQMVQRSASVGGLTELDLNYPDHVGDSQLIIDRTVADCGQQINGLAMRYHSIPGFNLGAFTTPDRTIWRAAIDLTKCSIDAARAWAQQ